MIAYFHKNAKGFSSLRLLGQVYVPVKGVG